MEVCKSKKINDACDDKTKKADPEMKKYACVHDVQENKTSLWEIIVKECETDCSDYVTEQKNEFEFETIDPQNETVNYLNKEVFSLLLPAMEKMLIEAKAWNVLQVQKCRFNGLDYLAEILWNSNPRYPKRLTKWLNVFDIPPFKEWLCLHPRPFFAKSWLWSKEEAASIIQRYVRRWLIRKQSNVQEMLQFWKAITIKKGTISEDLKKTDLGIQMLLYV